MDQLHQYIIAQEQAGFTEQQIRAALAQNGYPAADIDAAFRALSPAQADTVVHEYVQQYARQGYSAVQVFSMLRQQGYAANKVRRAINDVFGRGAAPSHAHALAFVMVAIALAVGGLYLMDDSPVPQGPDGPGTVVLSPPEIIAQVLEVTRQEGSARGVRECQERLSGRDRDLCILDVAVIESVSDKTLCTQIADIEYHDACLMNFLQEDFDYVCTRVKLAENRGTCEKIAALRQSAA